MSSLMLLHLPDELKRQVFVEIYRILKPSGRLRIGDFAAAEKPHRWKNREIDEQQRVQSDMKDTGKRV